MRGSGDPQEVMLAVVNLEERVPKGPSTTHHQGGGRRGTETPLTRVRPDVLQGGPGIGATGATASARSRNTICCSAGSWT